MLFILSLYIYIHNLFALQGGSPQLGMEFNQTGGPMQAERGSPWIPGLRDNTTGAQNLPGPPSFMAGQMGPTSQAPRPPAVSSIYNITI